MGTAKEEVRADVKPAAVQRRFRLLDAMILVAATAIGCGALVWLFRATGGEVSPWAFFAEVWDFAHKSRGEIGAEGIVYFCAMVAYLMSPVVATWTLVLAPVRLIGPRPRWRRLACQPGMMAVCASGLAVAGIGLLISCVAVVSGMEDAARWALETSFFSPMLLGLAVVTSWMTLFVGSRWRAERSWVDRFGRVVGCYWIVAGLLMICMIAIQESDHPFIVQLPHYSPSPTQAASEAEEALSDSGSP